MCIRDRIETQQSSDVTYRVYDYDRLQNGKPRELHVQQSIDCIVAPHEDFKQERVVKNFDGMTSTRLVKCPYYTPVSYTHLDVYKRQGLRK